MNRALCAVGLSLSLLLSACTVTSQDSDKVGMVCLEGHDSLKVDVEDPVFVCDKWVPSPGVTP